MTFIKRADLGRPLTWDELDSNFQQVDSYAAAAAASAAASQTQAQNSSQSAQQALQYQQAAETAAASAEGAVSGIYSDLASSNVGKGASLVGYKKNNDSNFSYRTVADVLQESLWFDDFMGSTDDEKWASLVDYQSKAIVTSTSVLFSSRMHTFNGAVGQLTKPFTLHGFGARSTILKFTNRTGVSADLSGFGSRYIQSRIAHLSIVADSVNAYTGVYFKGVQSFAPHDSALILDGVSIYGLRDIDSSAPNNQEWGIALHLDDVDEVQLHNTYICGSQLNATYLTRTSSKAIYANTVTGLRVSQSSIYLVGTGIEVTGQSEGFIGTGLTIVAVDYGVTFHDLISPANNHLLSDSHISAFTKGVEFRKHTDKANNPTSVFISNTFILEREGNASKPAYSAIEMYAIRSAINGIVIQSNTNTSPSRKALVVSNQENMVSNINGLNIGVGLSIDAVDTQYVMYSNLKFSGDLQSQLSGSIQYAVGGGLTNSGDPISFNVRADSFRTYNLSGLEQYSSNGGRHLFGGGRQNTSVYHDFRTFAGGTASYDGRILFTGGAAATDGQAQATIFASTTAFAGNIAGSSANTFTCGTVGRPWSTGYTQTAFTVTSDENAKTAPVEITDIMLDAWSDVKWVQYKYLDRVSAKGEDARWHHGTIAQRAVEAFTAHGLDASEFGFLCYDEWNAQDEIIDVETGEQLTPSHPAGSQYSIRYEEALVLEAALQRRNYKRLMDQYSKLVSRIEALENKS